MIASRAANTESFEVSTPSPREIRMTRTFSAPRALVFEAMTKPEHVKRWWGILDEGHSLPTCEIDLRPGGAWRYVGKSPQGEYGFHGVYHEVKPPERLVFTEIFDPYPDAESVVTVVLHDAGDKTRFELTAVYPSAEVRDSVLSTGMSDGAGKSYDALERLLAELRA